jgi:hypothetical protein
VTISVTTNTTRSTGIAATPRDGVRPKTVAGMRDDDGTGVRPPGADRARAASWRSDTAQALENVLGSAVPAFIVSALISGKAGVRDLARRSFRWRVPLRWYAISLLAPLLISLSTGSYR